MASPRSVSNQPNYGYFLWTTYNLSTFALSLIFGAFTFVGGAWWIQMRYTPNARAAGAKLHLALVWIAWFFTNLFYIFTACRSAFTAHQWTLSLESKAASALQLQIWGMWLTAPAFLTFSTAGWMIVLLIHAHILGTKLAPVHGLVRPSTTMFRPALGLLGCSAIFRGIAVPIYFAILNGVDSGQSVLVAMVEASLFLFASILLLYSVITIRKTTHMHGQSDPLRKVVLIAVPMWVIYGIVRAVFAAIGIAYAPVRVLVSPSLLLFGVSSLVTIFVLPEAIVGAESVKLEA